MMRAARIWVAALAAASAAQAPAAEPFDEPLVTITLDDGWSTQWTQARSVLARHGVKATFFITTDAVAQSWSGFLTAPQLTALAAEGHELGDHTLDHPDLTAASDAEILRQLSESQDWLVANSGVADATAFASPYGRYDARVLAAAKLLFGSHRTVQPRRNWRDGDPFELGAYDCFRGITVAQVNAWVDQAIAERSWIILLFHEFTTGTPTRSTQIRTSAFDAILAHVRQRGIRTVTIAEGVARMRAAPPDPPPPPPPPADAFAVYGDALENGFQDWSWAVHDLAQSVVVHSGARAISFEPDRWAGLYFHAPSPLGTAPYSGVELWVNGGAAGGQRVVLSLFQGGTRLGSAVLSDLLGGPIAAGAWQRVVVPFSALGMAGGSFDDLYLQDGSGGDQATLYLDDLRLLPR